MKRWLCFELGFDSLGASVLYVYMALETMDPIHHHTSDGDRNRWNGRVNEIGRTTRENENEHFCCWRIKCRLISFYLQLFFLSILCERLSIAFSLAFMWELMVLLPGTHNSAPNTNTELPRNFHISLSHFEAPPHEIAQATHLHISRVLNVYSYFSSFSHSHTMCTFRKISPDISFI